jgi:hypothetical protein
MLKRHEIETLLKAGHPKTEVARLAGVSAPSVHRIPEESPVVHVNDSAERAQRHIGRPSIVEDLRKFVATPQEATCRPQASHRLLRSDGGYSMPALLLRRYNDVTRSPCPIHQ